MKSKDELLTMLNAKMIELKQVPAEQMDTELRFKLQCDVAMLYYVLDEDVPADDWEDLEEVIYG